MQQFEAEVIVMFSGDPERFDEFGERIHDAIAEAMRPLVNGGLIDNVNVDVDVEPKDD